MKFSTFFRYIILVIFLFHSECICAQEVNWTPTSKSITFIIKNAKLPVKGSFEGLLAKIIFDTKNLRKASFDATILVSTIKTGIDLRDKHLKRTEYFNVEKFPEITLKSNAITFVKGNSYIAKCTLTIKGIAKEVELPFTFVETGNSAIFSGTLNLNRLDFGIGSSSVIMSNQLQVAIVLNAIKR